MIFIFFLAGNSEQTKIELIGLLNGNVYNTITVCVLVGIIQFFNISIYVSATAVSRDGLNATFIKYIPVSLYKQFIYKAVPNMILSSVPVLIVLGVFWYLAPQTSILFLLAIFVVSMLLNIIQSYINLIVDLKKPKLEWDTEYAVVKQNLNLVFPMLFALIAICLMVIFGFLLKELDYKLSLLILIVLFAVVTYVVDRVVYKNQTKLFNKIF